MGETLIGGSMLLLQSMMHCARPAAPQIMVRTGNTAGAGTDSKVWITLYGDKGDTGELELKFESEDVEEHLTLARPVTREAHLRGNSGVMRGPGGDGGGPPGGVELSRESVSSRQGARSRDKAKMDKLMKMVMKQVGRREEVYVGRGGDEWHQVPELAGQEMRAVRRGARMAGMAEGSVLCELSAR